MSEIERCECCEQPVEPRFRIIHPEEGDTYCAACVVDLIAAERDVLRGALAEIADGYERHNPGWWIKKAKAALARTRGQADG